jgi:hypothetical protein
VYLSKIWFFVIAAVAAIALGVAITMPRPAERKVQAAEDVRLDHAVRGVQRDLIVDAYRRVNLALNYARSEVYNPLKRVRDDREGSEAIAQPLHDSAHDALTSLIRKDKDNPPLLVALDGWGRVVARAGVDEKKWGEDLSGYFLVRDALRGYMRDDLWLTDGKLYRVAAAPVIAPPDQGVESYVGVLIVGREVDESLARKLASRVSTVRCDEGSDQAAACDTHVAFFARGEVLANSGPTSLAADIKQEFAKRTAEITKDGFLGPFTIAGEGAEYRVVAHRLPGEAGALDAFFAVYSKRTGGATLFGTLTGDVVKDDIAFGRFPWLALGGGFLVAVFAGLLLLWIESDLPLRRLVNDALELARGHKKNLSEELHPGKYGSVARSVNLALDKLSRDKAQTRRDLGALYATGEADEPRSLPPAPPLGPPAAPFTPPPSPDFALESSPSSASANSSFDYALPTPAPPTGGGWNVPPPAHFGERNPTMPGAGSVTLPPSSPPIAAAAGDRAAVASPFVERTPVTARPPLGKSTRTPTASDLPALPDIGRRAVPAPPAIQPARVAPLSVAPRPAPLPPPPIATLDDDILGQTNPGPPDIATLDTQQPRQATASGLNVSASIDSLGGADPLSAIVQQQSTPEGEEAYFRQVYEDFVELKRKCGEPTDSLTFEKFAQKLMQNRDALVAKYGCKAVKFQVYVKDGKAALKATPVKG